MAKKQRAFALAAKANEEISKASMPAENQRRAGGVAKISMK
jgi:hypothetical protein